MNGHSRELRGTTVNPAYVLQIKVTVTIFFYQSHIIVLSKKDCSLNPLAGVCIGRGQFRAKIILSYLGVSVSTAATPTGV